ncbi:type III secretion system inner membrane ring lipoprotein SctJ [Croceibacterium mercuriale]|uniref:type III secretion system inner membrane ring lipoprotein SctJ n=1 Tax=Croceibacterium mercuriale TaxID=1572751 RepID=UPI00068C797D|nr:type III secretion inner membrane ring lipoprotein SctJ [Croceibacterium mercuriale]
MTRFLLPFFVALALAGCGEQELHRDLTEDGANQIVAALAVEGIGAQKAAAEEDTWSVSVEQGDFAEAVSILRAQGLPEEEFQSLGEIFQKEGFTSSPLEERARLNYGLSQELSHTIASIDGVVRARVHLNLPQPDPLTQDAAPSSASVFVKYRPGFDLERQTGAIKTLVANSIEGLGYDRVSVVMVPGAAAAPETGGSLMDVSDSMRVLVLLVALGLIAAGAWHWWRGRRPIPAEPLRLEDADRAERLQKIDV